MPTLTAHVTFKTPYHINTRVTGIRYSQITECQLYAKISSITGIASCYALRFLHHSTPMKVIIQISLFLFVGYFINQKLYWALQNKTNFFWIQQSDRNKIYFALSGRGHQELTTVVTMNIVSLTVVTMVTG
jgi:hypothetical protein